MADITLTGTGGLFTRLGKYAFFVTSHNKYRGSYSLSSSDGASINSIGPNTDAIRAQYNTADQQVADNLYLQIRDSARAAMSPALTSMVSLAQTTLIEMAHASVPLNQKTVSAAMTVLIAQMVRNSDTVKANTVSASVTTGSANTGTAICIASLVNAAGKTMEYVHAENITLTAITDSQSGATAGRETWRATSPVAQSDPLMWNWPLGSGQSVTLTANAVDGSAQKLVNSDFEDWTVTNIPDYWTIAVGAATTQVARAATPYSGTYSLSLIGDGSTLTELRQEFNDGTNGTSYKLLPSTVYALNYWCKCSATPGAGVLTHSLINSSGTVINDDAGTANTITKDLTGVSTTWVPVSGFFRTPSVMPADPLYLRTKLTTALPSSRTVYIDDITMVIPTQFYAGGPYLAVFPGSVATVKNDTFSVAVANDWYGPANPTGPKFQAFFQQAFGMRSLGMQLPSSASNTINENLVNGL